MVQKVIFKKKETQPLLKICLQTSAKNQLQSSKKLRINKENQQWKTRAIIKIKKIKIRNRNVIIRNKKMIRPKNLSKIRLQVTKENS